MILVLGTSHVSKQSSREVKQAIAQAEVICIELDVNRAHGLLQKREATFAELRQALGLKAALMASVMRSLQKRIASSVGVTPGVEMKTALNECAAQQKTVVFIDRDVKITMQRLAKNFGAREVWQMMKDMFRRQKLAVHPSDDVVEQLLEQMKKTYPRIYNVMVYERDVFMARSLVEVAKNNPEKIILAVVGKGHVKGILHQVNYLNSQLDIKAWNSPGTS